MSAPTPLHATLRISALLEELHYRGWTIEAREMAKRISPEHIRLIAAAPEMFALLSGHVARFDSEHSTVAMVIASGAAVANEARALLARITGAEAPHA